VSALPNRSCPLCSIDFPLVKDLQRHLAVHLQRIALFTLPNTYNEDSGLSHSEHASYASVAEDKSRFKDVDMVVWSDVSLEEHGNENHDFMVKDIKR
jgi:delta-aminolevulinic acid dehydratase/porphobilinogen synthase